MPKTSLYIKRSKWSSGRYNNIPTKCNSCKEFKGREFESCAFIEIPITLLNKDLPKQTDECIILPYCKEHNLREIKELENGIEQLLSVEPFGAVDEEVEKMRKRIKLLKS
jgi:hypothetical protein